MNRFKWLVGLVFCFLCPVSAAAEIPYKGVWSGTIGNNKVQVCFSADDSHYYYLRHKAGINLYLELNEQNPNLNEWKERVGPYLLYAHKFCC